MGRAKKNICRWLVLAFLLTACVTGSGMQAEAASGKWKKDNKGWYYVYSNGKYARNEWLQEGGKWYHFDAKGYMQTGWKKVGGKTYFFKKDGSMAANEYWQGYWLNKSGVWTYKPKATWRKTNGKYWFGDNTGWYAKNQWLRINGKDYYFYKDGYLATNQWIKNSFVGADGAWVGNKLPKKAKKSVDASKLPNLKYLQNMLGVGDLWAFRHDPKSFEKAIDWYSIGAMIYWPKNATPAKITTYDGQDPKGKLIYGFEYHVVSEKDMEWYANVVLNASLKAVKAAPRGESDFYYFDNGKYYTEFKGLGGPSSYAMKDLKVTTDGVYYYLTYTLYDPEYDNYLQTKHMQAVVSYKYDRGQFFWSFYEVKEAE